MLSKAIRYWEVGWYYSEIGNGNLALYVWEVHTEYSSRLRCSTRIASTWNLLTLIILYGELRTLGPNEDLMGRWISCPVNVRVYFCVRRDISFNSSRPKLLAGRLAEKLFAMSSNPLSDWWLQQRCRRYQFLEIFRRDQCQFSLFRNLFHDQHSLILTNFLIGAKRCRGAQNGAAKARRRIRAGVSLATTSWEDNEDVHARHTELHNLSRRVEPSQG